MKILNISKSLPRKTVNGKKYWFYSSEKATRFVVFHHDGVYISDDADPVSRAKEDAAYMVRARWYAVGSQYHFQIARNGLIIQMIEKWKNEKTAHCSSSFYNARSIAITFQGNYQIQELTEAQKESAHWLVEYLENELGRKFEEITMHKITSGNKTVCPGKNAYDFVLNFKKNKKTTMTNEEAKRIIYFGYRTVLGREPTAKDTSDWLGWVKEHGEEAFIAHLNTVPEVREKKRNLIRTIKKLKGLKPEITPEEEQFYIIDTPNRVTRTPLEIIHDLAPEWIFDN